MSPVTWSRGRRCAYLEFRRHAGDGAGGDRAGAGSLTVSEINSHCVAGCPWEEKWTKDSCLHSDSECARLIILGDC